MNEDEIFDAALQLTDRSQRAAFIARQCAGNAALRTSVEELLHFHDTAGDFLASPLNVLDLAPNDLPPGTRIGSYELVEQIGQGGFGVVYRAVQHGHVRRDVALKLVKPGMDTHEVLARFQVERQALAMMQHPQIATVFEAGVTETGRPYFVMELVDGQPIDTFCDAHTLSVSERVELVLSICGAVQHAHQKGIVHRDLKPANILVARNGGGLLAKIIDFGIAKILDTYADGPADLTRQHELVGTLEYMSPEQLRGGGDIDTRTDVYTLGSVLYKLLTGSTPRASGDSDAKGNSAMLTCIRDDDVFLVAPSSRVARLSPGQGAAISRLRANDTRGLRQALRGELDWIVLKALAPDRNWRYPTMAAFAEDLERFLRDEPVMAAPPGWWYRVGKLARRHRVWFAAAALVTIAVLAGTGAAIYGFVHAERQRRLATEQWLAAEQQRANAVSEGEKAQQAMQLLQRMLGAANSASGRPADYTLRQMLDEFSAALPAHLSPEIEAEVRWTIGRAYRSFGELRKSQPHVERALHLCRTLYGETDSRTLRSRADQAELWLYASQGKVARQAAFDLLDDLRPHSASETLVQTYFVLAAVSNLYNDHQAAQHYSELAWQTAQACLGPDHPTSREMQLRLAQAFMQARQLDDAWPLALDAQRALVERYGSEHIHVAWANHVLGKLHYRAGELSEAERLLETSLATHRRHLGPYSSRVVADLLALTHVVNDAGRSAEAVALAHETVAVAEQVTLERGLYRLLAYRNLATLLSRTAPWDAVSVWDQAIQLQREVVDFQPEVGILMHRKAATLHVLGRYEDAAVSYAAARELLPGLPRRPGSSETPPEANQVPSDSQDGSQDSILIENDGDIPWIDSPELVGRPRLRVTTLILFLDSIDVLAEQGRLDECAMLVEELEELASLMDHPVCSATATLARVRYQLSTADYSGADALIATAQQNMTRPQDSWIRYRGFALRAEALMGQGDLEESQQTYERLLRMLRRRNLSWGVVAHIARRGLADVYDAQGKPARAKRLRAREQEPTTVGGDRDTPSEGSAPPETPLEKLSD